MFTWQSFRVLKSIFVLYAGVFSLTTATAQKKGTEILWDTYGVPHVFAQTIPNMYYAFGWSQMQNHANLILSLYGQARGKAAEYWGKQYLTSDKQIRLFKIPEIAAKDNVDQNPQYRIFLEAFVKGMNDYAAEHPEAISPKNKQVLPVTSVDVIAHGIRVVFLEFIAKDDIAITDYLIKPGSNSYAIAASRSASKNAMLLSNPHLPWYDFFTFFEAHLQAPGFNAYGVSLVGLPVLNIAFNDHLGWTHTVNPLDAADRYELKLQDNGYILDSAIVPFETQTVKLKVKQDSGVWKEEICTFNYSRHGPVLGSKNGKAYALRIAGLENADLFYQWHQMAMAKNWAQFDAALKMMQLPMFNVVYADQKGNILYLFDGNIPLHADGNWKFWHNTVDGGNSKYIWNQIIPYQKLPRLFNPQTGFVQNANDPPWSCTYPQLISPDSFPSYISPLTMQLRAQRAVNMIKNDSAITFAKFIEYKQNTEMEAANRFLQDLLLAVEKYPDSLATKAAAVLKSWDRSTNANSRGAILFARWYDKLNESMFLRSWDPALPLETPAGLKDPQAAVKLLAKSAQEITKEYDSLNVAWGDVYRFRINQFDLPANGGPDKYGIFRTIYYNKNKDNKYQAIAGDSYVAVIEFGKKARAQVLLSYGNASQPGSRHIGDQLELLSQKKMRTAWLQKEEILNHLEFREQLNNKPAN